MRYAKPFALLMGNMVDWVYLPAYNMSQVILLYNLYKIIMLATKRVAVTEPVWAEQSDLRRPGETSYIDYM